MITRVSWIQDVVGKVRSFVAFEWVGDDDLYLRAFSEVTPRLLLGRMPTIENVPQLRDRGVTHVISCLQEKRRVDTEFLQADFDHLFLSADDLMHQDLRRTFDRLFSYVDEARAGDSEPTLLVHCEVGVSRSASLAIALVMRDDASGFLDSFERVRSTRIQVLPNIAFASQLQLLEHELLPELQAAETSSLAVYLTRYCNVPCTVDVVQHALEGHRFDAPTALRSIYGGEIPRVVQGVRGVSWNQTT